MVVKNGLACGIMLALVGCATKPVSNEQATPVLKNKLSVPRYSKNETVRER